MKSKYPLKWSLVGIALFTAQSAQARVQLSPYVSIRSTSSIKPQTNDKSTERATSKQRQEAGLRGALSFWRLFSLQASVGQSKLTTTSKVQEAKDEYGEIDFAEDMSVSTDNPDNDLKVTETQRNARLSLAIDPGFWIFIVRAKAGVTATQRIIDTEETGKEPVNKTFGPTYKPHAGAGLGLRFSPKFYVMAEYNTFHYAFPKIEPFEREVAMSFAIDF
ncbi:MAG: hypothetical protein RL011_557 [Pseudomonadota bacterium]|jgi:hypothetical protein